jgi:pimeloyl-ACP methyl ester carboxylesterase
VSRALPLVVAAMAVFALVAAYWALLYTGQRAILFPAPPLSGAPPRPPDVQQIWLDTPSGRVEAWLLPPTGRWPGPSPLLIFTHGNGELIDHWPSAFDEPRSWGLAVLLLEYPGYGRSEGRPSDRAIRETMLAADDWARQQPGIDAARLIPYGRSLGGSAAAMLAAERGAAALVLESAFTSARAFASQFFAPGLLVRDPLDTLAAVRRFDGPVLVVHGERDEIVPVAHGRTLAAASPRAQLQVLPCGHNDCPRPWSAVHRFLDEHGLLPTRPDP